MGPAHLGHNNYLFITKIFMVNIHNNYVAIDLRTHVLRSCDLVHVRCVTSKSEKSKLKSLAPVTVVGIDCEVAVNEYESSLIA